MASADGTGRTDARRGALERDVDALTEQLLQTEQRLQSLLDNIPDCIARFDAECRHVFVSPAVPRLFGLPAEHFIGKRLSEVGGDGNEVQNARLEEMIRQAFSEGRANSCEAQWMTLEGERFFEILHVPERDEDGHIVSVLGIAHDITKRKQAENELRASEARFRTFADHAMDAFFLHGEGGIVLDANRQACASLGYSREELIGMSPGEFDADYSPEARGAMRARLDKGEIVTFSSHHRRKDGSTFPVEVRIRPFQDGNRRLYISTSRDASERERAEEDLHSLNRELRAISRCHQTLLRASDEQGLLDEICRIIAEEAGYRLAWVGYAEDDDAKTVRPVAWAGDDGEYLLKSRILWAADSPYGQGPSGASIRSGRIVHIQDIATDPSMGPWREFALTRGYRTCVSLPLKDMDARVFGALLIYSSEPDAITPEEVRLMEDLSHDLAFGISVLRNLHERKRAEDSLHDLNRELRAISRCHQTLLRADDEQGLLDDICRIIVEEAGYRLAWVGYVHHDEAKTIVPMAVAGHDQGYIESIVRSRFTWSGDTEHGRGPAGEAIRSREIVYIQDIANDSRMALWRERALERGYRSGFALPLKNEQGAVFGVMLVYSDQVDGINRDDIRLMEELSHDLAFGISVLRNRAERQQADEALKDLNRELGAISRCHQTLLRASDEQALLDDICRIIVEEAGYRMSWVGYVEHDEAKSIRPMSWAGFDSGYIKDAALTWDGNSLYGQGPSGVAVRTGEIIYAQDIANDPRMVPWREAALRRGYRSSIAVPLKGEDGQVFGVLTIYSPEAHAISADEMRLLGELADDMAFGIDVLRTREERRLAEEKYRTIFENSPLGIFRSTFEGRFVELNPAMAHMLGYDTPEAVMREIHDIGRQIYAEGHDRNKMVQAQLGKKGDAAQYMFRYRRRDGSEFDSNLYLKTVRNAGGDPVMFDGIVEDITERLQAEQERERLQAQLLQAQKMESVGRLAGGIAHDFNNMLAAIMGYAELALHDVDPAQRIYVHLQEIRKAATRSADLTRQLLAFARKQPTLPAVLDLNKTVEGMLKMLRRLIGEDIQLNWLPGKDLHAVRVDPSQVDQVLANLCVNARDAIDNVGAITIETRSVHLDQAYLDDHPWAEVGDYVLLAVRDDGCGMNEDTLARVFEPFFTTKGVGKGTGLGLAMVFGIVKQNGGFIDIESQPGRGTSVDIFLPPHTRDDVVEGVEETASEAMSRGHETILLVEDEPVVLDMTKLMLEECGYRVLEASSPDDAMRLAQAHAGRIRLLVTDVVMPGMNGHDLSSRLVSLYPEIRTLYMSGYTGNAIAEQTMLEQPFHFIQKPFTIDALAAKVREVLDAQ